MNEIKVYTDGACYPNPGKGGWAWVTETESESGNENPSTNQRMEMLAVIKALAAFEKKKQVIHIHTDSQFVIKGCTSWLLQWKRKGWVTAKNQPVKNRDLWLQLDALLQTCMTRFTWVKGHSGIELNERADQLANKASGATNEERTAAEKAWTAR